MDGREGASERGREGGGVALYAMCAPPAFTSSASVPVSPSLLASIAYKPPGCGVEALHSRVVCVSMRHSLTPHPCVCSGIHSLREGLEGGEGSGAPNECPRTHPVQAIPLSNATLQYLTPSVGG